MRLILIGMATLAGACLAGCSAQDPVTRTPDYHVGTPTNRSSVNSWELNHEPFYTQPGVNGGTPVSPPAKTASQRGYEPYDPIAEKVYSAISQAGVHTKYIIATAKNGVVILTGSVNDHAQLTKTLDVAEHVTGVKSVRNELTVAQTAVASQ